MWTLYADNELIWDPRLQGDLAKQYAIFDDNFQLEVSKAGSLTFTVYPEHPAYDKIFKLKTIITLYYGNSIYFRGRVLNDNLGDFNERKIQCEGELAFLVDSRQRPFSFPLDENHATPADYLAFLLARHNAQVPPVKRFVLGKVTVTDPNGYIARSDTEYSTTWQLINEGLLNTLGGYLQTRHEGDTVYLDYLADFDTLANQPVELGLNLLDISSDRRGEEVATAILPLGAKDDNDVRLTISGLEDDETGDVCKSGDIVYSKSAEARYGGRIVKPVTWDDVTLPANLLRKAKEQLGIAIAVPNTVTITAADASAAVLGNGVHYNTWRVGTYISVVDPAHADAHGLLPTYLLRKRSGSLQNPASNRMTFGATTYSYTEANRRQQEQAWHTVEANVTQSQAKAIRELEQRTSSAIQQSSEAIRTEVSENYYLKDETDEMVSSLSTKVEQTAKDIRIDFSVLSKDVEDVANGVDAQFSELYRYIRLENGNINLGEAGNEVTLTVQHDRVSILQSAAEVAYFSNQKLYVTDGEFLRSMRIGIMEFVPRSNGNLSLRKVAGT